MENAEYRVQGKNVVDFLADYIRDVREYRVFPDRKPGFLSEIIPDSAPDKGEHWQTIMDDIETKIMPGVTHWQSPHMHAYYTNLTSFSSMLGDMIAAGIDCLGFTWASCPVSTELETLVLNWLGKMVGLPDDFIHQGNSADLTSTGGGVIQGSGSESTLVCLLAARIRALKKEQAKYPHQSYNIINDKLVAYASDQVHSSVDKAALIGLVKLRKIESDNDLSMRGQALKAAIEEDKKKGLIPFWCCATLGTTGACQFDNLAEIGPICKEENIWLHVDAAYAGNAFVCPEFRHFMKGIEYADSFYFNPAKWLLVNCPCSTMWVKDSTALHDSFNVEPLYLHHNNSGHAIDYMHWTIPLSRRFNSLKVWCTIRNYGIEGFQKHIRRSVELAVFFESLVKKDERFEISTKRHLGLTLFRLKGENNLTQHLLTRVNARGKIYVVPATCKDKFCIRFVITSPETIEDDIVTDWTEIQIVAKQVLDEDLPQHPPFPPFPKML